MMQRNFTDGEETPMFYAAAGPKHHSLLALRVMYEGLLGRIS